MPDGRFLSKSIAHDLELNTVSFEADFLFLRCVPHLDREGRLPGHPTQVKGIAVPLRSEFTLEVVERSLHELNDADLVSWFEVNGRLFLDFSGFSKNQKGLRKNREAASNLPSQKSKGAQRVTRSLRSRSGVAPEDSGSDPAEVRPSEVKVSQGKVSLSISPPYPPGTEGEKEKTLEEHREAARPLVDTVLHLGEELVTVGKYDETIEDAMRRWDGAVAGGIEPAKLNAWIGCVRLACAGEMDPEKPLTIGFVVGPTQEHIRTQCENYVVKHEPVSPIVGELLGDSDLLRDKTEDFLPDPENEARVG